MQDTGHLYWADRNKGVVYRGCVDGYDGTASCDRMTMTTGVPLVSDVSVWLDEDDFDCR